MRAHKLQCHWQSLDVSVALHRRCGAQRARYSASHSAARPSQRLMVVGKPNRLHFPLQGNQPSSLRPQPLSIRGLNGLQPATNQPLLNAARPLSSAQLSAGEPSQQSACSQSPSSTRLLWRLLVRRLAANHGSGASGDATTVCTMGQLRVSRTSRGNARAPCARSPSWRLWRETEPWAPF